MSIDYWKPAKPASSSAVDYRKPGRAHEVQPGSDGVTRLVHPGDLVVIR